MARNYQYRFLYSRKSRTVAMLLCIFGGYLGLHYFYVRRYWRAALNLFLLLALGITSNVFGLRYFYLFRQPNNAVFLNWREAIAVISATILGVTWILDFLFIIQKKFRDNEKLLLK